MIKFCYVIYYFVLYFLIALWKNVDVAFRVVNKIILIKYVKITYNT
jgi:hypothetical protein